jgi:hypothetical protein
MHQSHRIETASRKSPYSASSAGMQKLQLNLITRYTQNDRLLTQNDSLLDSFSKDAHHIPYSAFINTEERLSARGTESD